MSFAIKDWVNKCELRERFIQAHIASLSDASALNVLTVCSLELVECRAILSRGNFSGSMFRRNFIKLPNGSL